MAKIKDDDCLLVGRDGVDYKVSYKDFAEAVEDSTGGSSVDWGDITGKPDVDLSEYAKLTDTSQVVTVKKLDIGDQSQPYSAWHSNLGFGYGWQLLREASDATGPAGVTNMRVAVEANRCKFIVAAGSYSFEVDGLSRLVNAPGFKVEAKEFIGDGSKLTNISLPDFRTLTPLT